jgi:hypothetical protein
MFSATYSSCNNQSKTHDRAVTPQTVAIKHEAPMSCSVKEMPKYNLWQGVQDDHY